MKQLRVRLTAVVLAAGLAIAMSVAFAPTASAMSILCLDNVAGGQTCEIEMDDGTLFIFESLP